MKTITITEKNWKRLTQWKYDLNCKSLDEVIERLLRIPLASDLNPSQPLTTRVQPSELDTYEGEDY